MTLPFEVRNEVLFIIVGFADHPVSIFPHSQPLTFYRQKLCKIVFANLKNLFSVICGSRIPDSGFRIPDSGFRFPIPDSGFRFPGFRVAPSKIENNKIQQPENTIKTTIKFKQPSLQDARYPIHGVRIP